MPNDTTALEDLDIGIFDLDIQIQEVTTAFPESQMVSVKCSAATCGCTQNYACW